MKMLAMLRKGMDGAFFSCLYLWKKRSHENGIFGR